MDAAGRFTQAFGRDGVHQLDLGCEDGTAFSVAISTETPVLEVTSFVQEAGEKMIRHVLDHVEGGN